MQGDAMRGMKTLVMAVVALLAVMVAW